MKVIGVFSAKYKCSANDNGGNVSAQFLLKVGF